MNAAIIIPAFLLGLASSLHCIGMCGPLSLAMPVGRLAGRSKIVLIASYQAGRIFTYCLFGLLAGIAGKGILSAGYQQTFSIVAGLIVVLAATGYFAGRRAGPLSFMNGFYRFLTGLLFKLLKTATRPHGAFLFGMANGLLPCGMVYIAAITAFALGDWPSSVLFMLLFGAGTLPAMLLVVFTASRLNYKARKWAGKLSPYIITAMGLLLILRGLNWGIPFLSPGQVPEGGVACHP
jgi:uncharacterized protein